MDRIESLITYLTNIGKWIAIGTMTLMMIFITFAVISRNLHYPIIGDVELVQLGMVVLIMFGIAYSERQNAHISIGLLVDRMPIKIQQIIDVIAYLFTFIVCMVIGWVSFNAGLKGMSGNIKSTDLLNIPHYPFKIIIALGFILWGLEALLKVVNAIKALRSGNGGIT